VASGYLYSRYQLLGLEAALGFAADLQGRWVDGLPHWSLNEADWPNAPTVAALASCRSLAICLSALDTCYWPQMAHTLLGDIDTWRTAFRDRDPARMLDWLGASLEQVGRQVTDLQMSASSCDDTGDFFDLIRRAKDEAWNSLRGDAAVTMDYCLAADILARFAEDIKPSRNNDPAALPSPPSQQGLRDRPHSLDAALTDLHLSLPAFSYSQPRFCKRSHIALPAGRLSPAHQTSRPRCALRRARAPCHDRRRQAGRPVSQGKTHHDAPNGKCITHISNLYQTSISPRNTQPVPDSSGRDVQ
jgi:hypothetical protein